MWIGIHRKVFLYIRKLIVSLIILFAIFHLLTSNEHFTAKLQEKQSNINKLLEKLGQNFPQSLRQLSDRDLEIESYRKFFNLHNPGAMGEGVVLPKEVPEHIQRKIDIGWKNYTMNEFVSSLIPLRRSLPDVRSDYCKNISNENLPKASVIIIFHNEAWSMLLRTIHSVLDRSPPELLQEIVLVDDFSDREHLQKPLEDYIAQYSKIKILRSPKRGGVMVSRMWGASNSIGPVLLFIDSHVEVMPGFMEPLLNEIAKNPNISAIPKIDSINRETMQLESSRHGRHGLNINLDHTWIPVPDRILKEQKDPWEPFPSVTLLGAIFSIRKDYLLLLGGFDFDTNVYGAEDIELALKIWMCGGEIKLCPCSRSAHMFRENFFYTLPRFHGSRYWNTDRIANVWLDSYLKYYYRTVGDQKRDFGDVSEALLLRKRLHCKSFEWFVENIYPEIPIPDSIKDMPVTIK